MTVEQRQIFIACDGKEFKTKEECIKYEKSISELTDIITYLKKIREICHKQTGCGSCVFYNDCSDKCVFKEEYPEFWDLEGISG